MHKKEEAIDGSVSHTILILSSFIFVLLMLVIEMHNCVFTCIGILSHYDEYITVHYETDYDHHVRHDDTTTAILSGCLAIAH